MKKPSPYDIQRRLAEGCLICKLEGRGWGATKSLAGSGEMLAEQYAANGAEFSNASVKTIPWELRTQLTKLKGGLGATLAGKGLKFGDSFLVLSADLNSVKKGTETEIVNLKVFYDELKAKREEIGEWQADNLKEAAPGIPSDEELDELGSYTLSVIPVGKFGEGLEAEASQFEQGILESMRSEVAELKDMLADTAEAIKKVRSGEMKRIKLGARWDGIRERMAELKDLQLGDALDAVLEQIEGMVEEAGKVNTSIIRYDNASGDKVEGTATSALELLDEF